MSLIKDSVQRSVPITGGTVTATNADGDIFILLEPAGTLATLTVASPSAPIDGQRLIIMSSQIITALTLSVGTFVGGVTTLAANGFASYIYNVGTTKWYRIG